MYWVQIIALLLLKLTWNRIRDIVSINLFSLKPKDMNKEFVPKRYDFIKIAFYLGLMAPGFYLVMNFFSGFFFSFPVMERYPFCILLGTGFLAGTTLRSLCKKNVGLLMPILLLLIWTGGGILTSFVMIATGLFDDMIGLDHGTQALQYFLFLNLVPAISFAFGLCCKDIFEPEKTN
jgi:hypothetical protein